MLDVIKHIVDDSFVFQQENALLNCCSAKFSTFSWAMIHSTAQSWTPWLQDLGSRAAEWLW